MEKPLLIACLLVGMLPTTSKADDESIWQRQYCEGMELEKHLPSGGYVDCLNPEYAIEVEWAQHWAEAVGQSLYYAGATNRKPGIILFCEQSEGPAAQEDPISVSVIPGWDPNDLALASRAQGEIGKLNKLGMKIATMADMGTLDSGIMDAYDITKWHGKNLKITDAHIDLLETLTKGMGAH